MCSGACSGGEALGRHEHFLAGDPDYVGEEAVRIDEENHKALPLGDRPLLVLIRDTTVERSHDPLHVRHQQAMAGLSSRGEYRIVPGAGHHIQVDRPDAVIDAVRKVVREIRERP